MTVRLLADGARLRRRLPLWIVPVLGICLVLAFATNALAVTFDPGKIISDDNFRDYTSLNQQAIQAFLDSSPVLATYKATDYSTGKPALASQIIYNASQHFHINPKVILTMLQKEQSLLTRSKSSLVTGKHATLDWALGMGCPDGTSSCIKAGCHTTTPPDTRYPEYSGFGRQIWAAAWNLDAYGEKGKTRPAWHHASSPTTTWTSDWTSASTITVGGKSMMFANLATFKLYTYNPSIGAKTPYGDLSSQASSLSGNASFWWLYRKYFGDTFANPAVRPVYRFVNVKNGDYFYTDSPTQRYKLLLNKSWKYQKVAFSVDTSVTTNVTPVYEYYNKKTHHYLFSAATSLYKKLRSKANAKVWSFRGTAFKGAPKKRTSATAVYCFKNRKTGVYFYTSSTSETKTFKNASHRKKWSYLGVAFRIGHR